MARVGVGATAGVCVLVGSGVAGLVHTHLEEEDGTEDQALHLWTLFTTSAVVLRQSQEWKDSSCLKDNWITEKRRHQSLLYTGK